MCPPIFWLIVCTMSSLMFAVFVPYIEDIPFYLMHSSTDGVSYSSSSLSSSSGRSPHSSRFRPANKQKACSTWLAEIPVLPGRQGLTNLLRPVCSESTQHRCWTSRNGHCCRREGRVYRGPRHGSLQCYHCQGEQTRIKIKHASAHLWNSFEKCQLNHFMSFIQHSCFYSYSRWNNKGVENKIHSDEH